MNEIHHGSLLERSILPKADCSQPLWRMKMGIIELQTVIISKGMCGYFISTLSCYSNTTLPHILLYQSSHLITGYQAPVYKKGLCQSTVHTPKKVP